MKFYFSRLALIILLIFAFCLAFPRPIQAGQIDTGYVVTLSNGMHSTISNSVYTDITIPSLSNIDQWTAGEKIRLTFEPLNPSQPNSEQFDIGALTTSDVSMICDPPGADIGPLPITISAVNVTSGSGTNPDYATITTGGTNNCPAGDGLEIAISGTLIRTPFARGTYTARLDTYQSNDTPITSDDESTVFVAGDLSSLSGTFYKWDTNTESCTGTATNIPADPVCSSDLGFTDANDFVGWKDCADIHELQIDFSSLGGDTFLQYLQHSDISLTGPLSVYWPYSSIGNRNISDCSGTLCLAFYSSSGKINAGNPITINLTNITTDNSHVTNLPGSGTYHLPVKIWQRVCEDSTPWSPGHADLVDQGAIDVNIATSVSDTANIYASVDPVISLNLSANTCRLGTLRADALKTCSYTATVQTNAVNGYTGYISQNQGFKSSTYQITDESDDSLINGAGTLAATYGEYGIGIQTTDAPDYLPAYPAVTDPATDCAAYDSHTSDLPALGLGDTNDHVFASSSAPVDGATSGLTTFCHGVRIKYDTPPGVYSHVITITAVGNF